jgi:hypothetical protein
MTPSSKQYFANLGIDVEFNTIGRNNDLIQAYIANTQSLVSIEQHQISENIKFACYSQFYTFAPRQKFTGFENFKEQDIAFRIANSDIIVQPQVRPCLVTEKNPSSNTYKETLISSFSDFTKPIILYLSGGLDSELLALALLEAGKPFTPVIFCWTSNDAVKNQAEVQFAFDFCAAHNLTPIIKSIDVSSLWSSSVEFKQLSVDIQIVSPQLTTHAYMVLLMNSEIPNAQHLFGGEVRYRTNYLKDDNSLANIILLGKVAPGYNGNLYTRANASAKPVNVRLNLSSSGAWNIVTGGIGLTTGSPLSGTWAVAPLAVGGYEYRITAVSGSATGLGIITPDPIDAPTAWSAISGGDIASCELPDFESGVHADGTFYIEIRPTAFPAQVMSSSVELYAGS